MMRFIIPRIMAALWSIQFWWWIAVMAFLGGIAVGIAIAVAMVPAGGT